MDTVTPKELSMRHSLGNTKRRYRIDGNKTLGVVGNFLEDLTSVWCEKAFLSCKTCLSEELLSCHHARWWSWAGGGEGRFESSSTQAAPSKFLFPWLWLSLHQGLDWSCLSQGSNCQRNHLVWFLVTDSQEQKSLWEEIVTTAAAARGTGDSG